MAKDKDENEKLWQSLIKGIIPLDPERKSAAPSTPKNPKKPVRSAARATEPRVVSAASQTGSDGIDRRSFDKFRKGRMPLDGVLDLHGMRQGEALDSLKSFIIRHSARGSRCLLVITGKGNRAAEGVTPGVLRKQLPEWLNLPDIAGHVLKHSSAQPKDGGKGAYYILLRRKA